MSPRSWAHNSKLYAAGWVLIALIVWVHPALGQVTIGENTNLNLAGWLGFGYNAGWEDPGFSNHSTSVVADLNLNGSYYNPNFLSFTVHPFYNRNQTNTVSQTTGNTNGFESFVNLFRGSHFPGTVGFSRQSSDAGELGIPGAGFLSTNGQSQNFSIGWSALVPSLPTFSVNFSDYSSSASVVGTTNNSEYAGKNLNMSSTYSLAGFQLMGFYNHQNLSLSLPDFVTPGTTGNESTSSVVGASASHRLPLSGSFNSSWSRSSYGGNNAISDGNHYNNVNAGATILPTSKLTLSSNVSYVDNFSGVIQQTITGGVLVPVIVGNSSQAVVLTNEAFYSLGHGLGVEGYANHYDQYFEGQHRGNNQYGGLVTFRFARPLLGMLYFNFGLVNTTNETRNNSLGFTGNVGLTKRLGHWETNADFSYQQSVQTLAGLYTTSNVNYGGNVRRRLNMDTYWSVNARVMHNALTMYEGDSNRSDSFGTSVSWRRYTASGYYSQASGSSVLAANGTFVPTPLAPVLTPDVLYYDGRSYSISLAANPRRHLTFTAYYSNIWSQTAATVYSVNSGNRYNALVEYEFRKLAFRGGYTRTAQSVSAASTLPERVNTYFFSVQRWFDIF